MKRTNKLIISWLAVIIVVIGIGIVLNKNSSSNKFSNSYLSSKSDGEKSFVCKTNDKSTNNSESFDFSRFDGKWSLMEINSPKNNKITINDNTKISKGKFYVVVLDPNYNIITKTESNEKTNLNFTTPKDGKYIIRIVGQKAKGNFNIKVNSTSNIVVNHKDIFD